MTETVSALAKAGSPETLIYSTGLPNNRLKRLQNRSAEMSVLITWQVINNTRAKLTPQSPTLSCRTHNNRWKNQLARAPKTVKINKNLITT